MYTNYFDRRDDYGFSCPSGGNWYSCGSGSLFVGCCAGEACTNGCSAGNIRPASFDRSDYGQFPDLQCPGSAKFYTCAGTNPPFWGCCKSSACSGSGCPSSDVVGAILDTTNPVAMSKYAPSGVSSSAKPSATSASGSYTGSSSSTTGSSSASTASTITNALTTPTSTPSQIASHEHPNVGAIAGGAAGGVAVIAIVIGLLIYYFRHANKSRKARTSEVQERDTVLAGAASATNEKAFSGHSPNPSLPPYSSPTPEYTQYHHHEAYYDDPATKQAYELSATMSPKQSVARRPTPQKRLSELSADPARRAELESPHHSVQSSPNPQMTGGHSPQVPYCPHSQTSNEADWTTHPWSGGYDGARSGNGEDGGLGIERGRRSDGYPGT